MNYSHMKFSIHPDYGAIIDCDPVVIIQQP